MARTYFGDAERVLDWYNLVEHVWEAARGLCHDEQAAKTWASRCTGLLQESSGIGLLRYLERCRRSHASKPGGSARVDALDGLLAYLRPRVAMPDYVAYRAIGPGIMESTCEQLVGQRLNRWWEDFWSSRPLHRAA